MYGSFLPWVRNIFIDCGGNNGSSVRKFRKEFDPGGRFAIYTFEPNDIYESDYFGFKKHTLINAAVHDKDGTTQFFLDREDGDGSSLFKNKLTRENGGFGTLDIDAPELVQTVDLSRWIRENTTTSDYLILKLDVEGAEYDILEKLAAERMLSKIKHLFVEWHWMKVGIPKGRHDHVVELLSAARVKVSEWDACGY